MKKISVLLIFVMLLFSLAACQESSDNEVSEETEKYIGDIVSLFGNSLNLNDYEFITDDDTDRISELGLTRNDMPNGYYIYDVSSEIMTFMVDEEAEYTFYDVGNTIVAEEDDKKHTTKDIEEFKTFLYGDDDIPRGGPFWINVKGDRVISIEEEFVP